MSKAIILAAGQKVQAGPGAGHQGELEAHLLEDNSNRRHQELPSVLGKVVEIEPKGNSQSSA